MQCDVVGSNLAGSSQGLRTLLTCGDLGTLRGPGAFDDSGIVVDVRWNLIATFGGCTVSCGRSPHVTAGQYQSRKCFDLFTTKSSCSPTSAPGVNLKCESHVFVLSCISIYSGAVAERCNFVSPQDASPASVHNLCSSPSDERATCISEPTRRFATAVIIHLTGAVLYVRQICLTSRDDSAGALLSVGEGVLGRCSILTSRLVVIVLIL